jgi:hypothetical protein
MKFFFKETNTQIVEEIFYKFFIAGRGHFSFMFKNNARAFLEPVDFKRCRE